MTQQKPDASGVLTGLGVLVAWGWLTFTYCPPLFWLLALAVLAGLMRSGGGGSGTNYNCGPGGSAGGD